METSNDFCSRLHRTDKFGQRDAMRGLTGYASTSVPFLFLSYQHPYEWLFLLLKFIDLSELISRPSCSFHNRPERRRRRRRRELNRKRCNFGAVCRTGRGWITAGLSRIECLFDDLINYLGSRHGQSWGLLSPPRREQGASLFMNSMNGKLLSLLHSPSTSVKYLRSS